LLRAASPFRRKSRGIDTKRIDSVPSGNSGTDGTFVQLAPMHFVEVKVVVGVSMVVDVDSMVFDDVSLVVVSGWSGWFGPFPIVVVEVTEPAFVVVVEVDGGGERSPPPTEVWVVPVWDVRVTVALCAVVSDDDS